MSVIVARAIPDVRDGLKPVQRRILVAMNDLGSRASNRGFHRKVREKSAATPRAITTPARRGRPFIRRSCAWRSPSTGCCYPLIDGAGELRLRRRRIRAAAMRYNRSAPRENHRRNARRSRKGETVDFIPNFDQTREEPVVLPSKNSEPAGERRERHPLPSLHGRHEHPAAQPGRNHRRRGDADRQAGHAASRKS